MTKIFIKPIRLKFFKYVSIFFLLVSIHSIAQQGNYRFNNFGNRSILLSGNVTGSVSDLGLVYYNPSYITDVENVGFSLNAKGYQLIFLKFKDALNEDSNLSNTSFRGTAVMAGGIFNLFGTRFAYSYFTKANNNINLNYGSYYLNDAILAVFPDAVKHNAKIGLQSNLKDDWTGITWGKKINDNFSFGFSAFASFYTNSGLSNVNHTIQSSDNEVAYYQNIIGFKQKSYGIFIKIGANYHFPKFDLGLNINLPYIDVYDEGSYSYSEVISGVAPEYNLFVDNNFKDLSAKRKDPLGISLGAGIPIKKSKLHLNIDYVSSLNQYSRIDVPDIDTGDDTLTPVNFNEERKIVINFGVGTEVFINENFKAYAGFSTDFYALVNSTNIFDLASDGSKDIKVGDDFYHLSLGVNWTLKWANLIGGITYTNGSSKFLSPYTINFEGIDINNDINSSLTYTRWQFVVGIDVPILSKKVKEFTNKKKDSNKKE
ncbi:hypothetical protein [Formosa maritima]|uniref:Long-chain fatty acid transport protein n=1 Tax=Formosa maritima TaxID=2592046 RepID=A0A5D0G198_9FLAO|nr:hypothetical protein [Formosa maritima]TYA52320.1 hypothetical protein FVF61_13340 [Formosa maritima]